MLDDTRVITGRAHTIAEAFRVEVPRLQNLPVEEFGPTAAGGGGSAVGGSVRQCYYSVPARYAGRRLTGRLSATAVEVYDGATVVAAMRGLRAAISRCSRWIATWKY